MLSYHDITISLELSIYNSLFFVKSSSSSLRTLYLIMVQMISTGMFLRLRKIYLVNCLSSKRKEVERGSETMSLGYWTRDGKWSRHKQALGNRTTTTELGFSIQIFPYSVVQLQLYYFFSFFYPGARTPHCLDHCRFNDSNLDINRNSPISSLPECRPKFETEEQIEKCVEHKIYPGELENRLDETNPLVEWIF